MKQMMAMMSQMTQTPHTTPSLVTQAPSHSQRSPSDIAQGSSAQIHIASEVAAAEAAQKITLKRPAQTQGKRTVFADLDSDDDTQTAAPPQAEKAVAPKKQTVTPPQKEKTVRPPRHAREERK